MMIKNKAKAPPPRRFAASPSPSCSGKRPKVERWRGVICLRRLGRFDFLFLIFSFLNERSDFLFFTLPHSFTFSFLIFSLFPFSLFSFFLPFFSFFSFFLFFSFFSLFSPHSTFLNSSLRQSRNHSSFHIQPSTFIIFYEPLLDG